MEIGLGEAMLLAMTLSIALALLGILLIALGSLRERGGEARAAGVVLIGPVPIVLGNDRELIKWAIVLTLAALALFATLALTQLTTPRWFL